MKNFAVISLVALTLAGCQTIEESRAAVDRADDARCQQFGARRGTPGYVQCRNDLERNRAIESANRRPTVVVTQPVYAGPVYGGPIYGGPRWGGPGFGRGPGFCRQTPWGVRCY
jgi:hypothetical protein